MSAVATRLRTYWALGLSNLVRVGAYRIGLRSGLHPVQRIVGGQPKGTFFAPSRLSPIADVDPPKRWSGSGELFGLHKVALGAGPPDWLCNPLNGTRAESVNQPWWRVADFESGVGDIKLIWEWSRFDWVIAFAQRARQGDAAALDRLNLWLSDWIAVNPTFRGPNWKCGQETSIRVMHLAMAALLLGQERDTPAGLLDLIQLHLRRIAPTLAYATAQDNNHGTSEAAALFIGGSWLAANGRRDGTGFARAGRRRLEERVGTLVMPDGTFSQYSVTYHRVMLDTIVMAEAWRRRIGAPAFSSRFAARGSAATRWLRSMVSARSGDAPNIGANDGARLLPLTDASYRDFRPSVALASALFDARRAFAPGPQDEALRWLDIPVPEQLSPPLASETYGDGGFAVLRRGDAWAVMRFPRFRFRPGHADALHLDVWIGDENLLRDGGTYSYNDGQRWIDYFGGVASHNTVQFDGVEQMPRLGRFLLGDWLATRVLEPIVEDEKETLFGAAYRDRAGRDHLRRVALGEAVMRVEDDVAGFARKAVLRWRLAPGDWRLENGVATDGRRRLAVEADVPIVRREIVVGQESRHYFERSDLPVLEVEIATPGKLTTLLRWT